MIVSSFKRYIFLVSFLLSHGSPLVMTSSWGMISDEEKEPLSIKSGLAINQSQSKVCLRDGLEAFEESQFERAEEIFTYLHSQGAITPCMYLEHLWKNNLTKSTRPQVSLVSEPVPVAGISLSQEFLKASLAYIDYKKKNNKSTLQKLGLLILSGNAHALSLMRKLSKNDKNIWNTLKSCNNFKKLKSLDDLYNKFKPEHKDLLTQYWNCLDKDILCTSYKLYNIEVTTGWQKAAIEFSTANKDKSIGEIALNLLKIYHHQPVWHSLAFFWAHLAVEDGMSEGCEILARITLGWFKSDQDSSSKFNGLSHSRYYTSKLFENEIETDLFGPHGDLYSKENQENSKIKARLYYKRAAPLSVEAQYNYAQMLFSGEGGEKNINEGLQNMEDAARKGVSGAQTFIACKYYEGEDIEQNYEKARFYYKLAADQGDSIAQFNYGTMCLNGKGGDINLSEACKFIKSAADAKFLGAQVYYATMCRDGEGLKQDFFEARKYYKMAADQDDAMAMYNYAATCVNGKGGPVDYVEALKYFQKADKKGFTYGNGLFWCGWIYYIGQGMEKNLEIARLYFKLSADLGYSECHYAATFNYALMCYNREGGPQDLVEAKKYFTMGADQGDEKSILALHICFHQCHLREKFDDGNKGEDTKQASDLQDSDSDVVIQLPSLESADDSSDEEKEAITMPVPQSSEKVQETPSHETKEDPENQAAEIKLKQELEEYTQKNAIEHEILKAKKKAQKEAAALTRHTLTVSRKEYDQASKSLKMEMLSALEKKSDVSHDTLAFVKTIFGQGNTKINTFSNTVAQQAFADLGCGVESKKGENSTLVSFALEGERVMKLKYHNPHGHGDDNLYDALKPHLKRFLQSIKKTPETLQVK